MNSFGLPPGYSPFPVQRAKLTDLKRVRKAWRECKSEIRLARAQCKTELHLGRRVGRVAIRAMRTLLDAFYCGVFVRIGLLDSYQQLRTDIDLGRCWQALGVPWVRAVRPDAFFARAGSRDWPTHKFDGKGRPLGKDGKLAIKRVKGKIVISEYAYVEDDYSKEEKLERQRFIAADFAAACGAMADMVDEQLADVGRYIRPADERKSRGRPLPGRPRGTRGIDQETDARVISAWRTGNFKSAAECAREVGGDVTARDVKKIVDRLRKKYPVKPK